jgi:hypothetical protein
MVIEAIDNVTGFPFHFAPRWRDEAPKTENNSNLDIHAEAMWFSTRGL